MPPVWLLRHAACSADINEVASTSSGELGRRIAYVDGLRAIAVLGVVIFHTSKWDEALPAGPVQHFFSEGAHGVDLFFVLSGFCLSYPFLRAMHERGQGPFDIAVYMARRVVRIVPPYYFAIAALAAALAIMPHVGWKVPETFSLARVDLLEVGKQAIFADRRPQFVNPSFWTLAIEWRWYFLFPLLLLLWARSVRAFALIVVTCGVATALTRAGGFDLPVLPAFMLGIVAAEIELRQMAIGRIAVLLGILSLCVAVYLEPHFVLGYYVQMQPGWQLASFFFVLAAGSLPFLRNLLSIRPLVWIGVASYSIYLMHEPLIASIEHNTKLHPVVVGGLGVLAGIAFWAVFERPFMTKPTKGALVNFIAPKLCRFMAFCGVPTSITLQRPAAGEITRAPQPSDELSHPSGEPEVRDTALVDARHR